MDLIDIHSERPFTGQLDFKFRIGKTIVFAMVEHRKNETGTAALLSLDGYHANAKWFPLSPLRIERSQGEERFLVVQVPGWLANKKELPGQNTRPRLSAMIAWTDEQQAEWRHVTSERLKTIEAVRFRERGYRKTYSRMRFGETA